MVATSGRSRAFVSCAVVLVRFRSWACVGVHLRLWAAGFVRGCVFQCGTLVVRRGRSCCSRVVAGGVSFVVVGRVTWALLLM